MLLFSMDSIIELNFTVTLLYIRKTWEDPFASKVWGGGRGGRGWGVGWGTSRNGGILVIGG